MLHTIKGTNTPPKLDPEITIAIPVALFCDIQEFTECIEGTNPPIEKPKDTIKKEK